MYAIISASSVLCHAMAFRHVREVPSNVHDSMDARFHC